MKTVAVIPARGGSKGLPGKNIRKFCGKPLIVHSIDQAIACPEIDGVFVSTDDSNIADIAKSAGAEIIWRPAETATDTATSESAVKHALLEIEREWGDFESCVFLQCTSPLRPINGLSDAMQKFKKERYDSLLSISPTHRFFWRVDGENTIAEYDYMNRPRRQDMKASDIRYVENGSLYIFTKEHFLKTGNRLGGSIGNIVFDELFSYEIDSEADFIFLEKIAESLLKKGAKC